MIVREVPEKRFAVQRAAALEQGREAQAVLMLRGPERQAGHVEQRRIEVH